MTDQEALAILEREVGEWDADSTITPGPGAQPMRQHGRASNRLVGGKWLVMDYTSPSFSGHGIYGWDPSRQSFTGTWVDSMATSQARSTGSWDAASQTMTWTVETMHAGKPVTYRELVTTQADGSRVYRNLVPLPDGQEHEMLRIVYTRRR